MAEEVKRRTIFDYCRKRADICLLQETHSTSKSEKYWVSEWGGKIVFSHGDNDARGVCILLQKNSPYTLYNVQRDLEGRILNVDVKIDNKIWNITNVYAPNKNCVSFFNDLSNIVRDKCENKIILGDYNCTLNSQIDRLNTSSNNDKNVGVINDMIRDFLLEDTWRVRNPDVRQFTWIKSKSNIENKRKASRIDYALISRGAPIEDIIHVTAPNTDHRSVYLVLKENDTKRGKGYWKFNCKLLTNNNYIDFMNQELEKILISNGNLNPIEKWEYLKQRITKISQNYSRRLGSEKRLIQSQLMEKLDKLESKLPLSKEMDKILDKTRQDLEEITDDITRGIIFRSKCKWYLEGEQNTKYFFSLEKSRYNARLCESLIYEGTEIKGGDQVLRAQTEFYRELYRSDKSIIFNSDGLYGGEKVSEDMLKLQDVPFTTKCLGNAAKQLKNERTPGPDGIPIDFYKVFWEKLKEPLLDMVCYAFEIKTMPPSMMKGILNLIPKPNKDSRQLKNLRPITLLNSDYKIIEKAISDKMKPALETVISKDQTGFMKNRRISINIRKLFDLMAYCNKYELAAQGMSCDFVKCFDRIEKTCILNALRYFHFSEYIIQWIDLLYTNFSVNIQNNGNFSEKILIERSVHQGGGCSAEIFLVCVEILAIMLRENGQIKGINVNEISNLLDQFADNLDVTTMHDPQSVSETLSTFNNFGSMSGFKLSYEKTSIYRIGSIKNTDAQYYTQDIKWTNNPINVLGVYVSNDLDECMELNYNTIICKIKNTLNNWINRDLSLLGKVTVVNTLIASLFVYKMTVLPTLPEKLLKNINNEITRFLWNNKKSKIKLATLQKNKRDGGLNLVNLRNKEISIKCSWVQILETDEKSANLAYSQMDPIITSDIWKCNLNKKDISRFFAANKFWHDALQAWAIINYREVAESDVENQVIWWNSHIRIAGHPFRWTQSYNKGLLWVSQLYEQNKLISVREANERYGLNYMQFYSLTQAIPSQWKTFLETRNLNNSLNFYESMLQKKNLTSVVYKILQNKDGFSNEKIEKWRLELELGVEFRDMYIKSFRDLYCVTNVPKFRSFQYRLLHRAIITNVHLKRWGILDNDDCEFCKREKETYTHLFCECEYVTELWGRVKDFIQGCTANDVDISNENIIMSKITSKVGTVENLICIVVKQYIYRQRCLKKALNGHELVSILYRIKSYEKFYAIKNNKRATFCKKWNCTM